MSNRFYMTRAGEGSCESSYLFSIDRDRVGENISRSRDGENTTCAEIRFGGVRWVRLVMAIKGVVADGVLDSIVPRFGVPIYRMHFAHLNRGISKQINLAILYIHHCRLSTCSVLHQMFPWCKLPGKCKSMASESQDVEIKDDYRRKWVPGST